MKQTKKTLMVISLSTLAVACLMLIVGIFNSKFIFNGIPFRILLVFGTISLATGLSITEFNVVKQKKTLGYVSLSLLAMSTLFAIIIFCSPLLEKANVFNQITEIVSIFSILFLIITSLYAKLGKKIIALQIVCYICLCAIDIILSLQILNVEVFKIKVILDIFLILLVITIGTIIALLVVSSKKPEVEKNTLVESVTISKTDYQRLIEENKNLKKQLELLQDKNKWVYKKCQKTKIWRFLC